MHAEIVDVEAAPEARIVVEHVQHLLLVASQDNGNVAPGLAIQLLHQGVQHVPPVLVVLPAWIQDIRFVDEQDLAFGALQHSLGVCRSASLGVAREICGRDSDEVAL